MAVKKLSIPDSSRTLIFRALQKIVFNNPVVNRVVKNKVWWQGDDGETNEPNLKTLPYMSIYPVADGAQRVTERTAMSPMEFMVYAIVDGSNLDDAFNLWSAVESAIFPGDGTTQAALTAATTPSSFISLSLSKPAFGPGEVSGSKVQEISGSVCIFMQTQTGL